MTLSELISMLLGMLFPSKKDVLLGIRWKDRWLVSFDPKAGTIIEWHTQLPQGDYRGLTYDPVNNKLYALAQGSKKLYSIDPATLTVQLIGQVDIGGAGGDVSSITYNPVSRVLYAAAVNVPGTGSQISQLFAVDPATAAPAMIGTMFAPFVNSICFSDTDGQLYGYVLNSPPGDSGSWDSPFKSSLVRIDPSNASMATLFETAYHTIMGLAKIKNKKRFYAWVNWTSHSYALVDVYSLSVSLLANSDQVGVTSDAMIYRDFYVKKGVKPLT